MASTATVVVKATGASREVSTESPILLDAASTVTLQLDPDRISTISRSGVAGRDLVVVLTDGTQIVISNYFSDDAGAEASELVLQDSSGSLWWLRVDPETGGFLLVGDEAIPVASALGVSSGEGAAVGAAEASAAEGGSKLAIGLGLGALALGVAAAGGGGGSGSGGTPPPTTPPPSPPPTDTTPPAPPTGQFDATGSTLRGTAEAGSTVNVYDAAGMRLGTAVAGPDGTYTITFVPPLTAGQVVTVTATDAAGNVSSPTTLTAPDLTDVEAPAAPVAVITAAGDAVNGTAEAGSTVRVYDADGNLLGSAVAGPDGRYTIPLSPPLVAGETILVTATDAAGNESAPTTLTAPDFTDDQAPEPPTALIDATGASISGIAEAGATVNVYDAGGTLIGTGVAGTDGRYTIALAPPLTAGETVTVTATDAAGNVSQPTSAVAPDLTDTTAPDAPTGVINDAGDSVSGTAEVGATVNVYDAGGTLIGTAVAGTDGRYTIPLAPPLLAGETVTVTATDAAGNESAPTTVTAPDLTDSTAPDAPTAAISAQGDAISGRAEVGATVNVYDADGTLLGTAVAGTDGRYTIPLAPPLVAGEVVTVTATDAALNESAPTSATAPDLSDTTAPPSPVAAINEAGDTVSGSAEVNTTVRIYDAQGNVLGTQLVGADGLFAITLAPPLTGGEQLSVTATNSAGIESFPTTLFAPDLSDDVAPAAPTAVITAAGDAVSGAAEAGATVTVRGPDGTPLGTTVAGTDGRYTIALVPPLTSGEALTVTATDAAGNVSDPTALFAPDLTDTVAPAAPTAVITAAGDAVSGVAEAGTTVIVRDADGTALGQIVAGTDGRYTIPLAPPLTSGEALTVTATDAAGNVSDPTSLFAPDLVDTDAPAAPSAVINDAGDTVTGIAEAGATVTVYDANGAPLGTAVAGTDGRYTIGLSPALTGGEALTVTARDSAGNESDPTALTAPLLIDDEAPDAPSATISAAGDSVSGLAEPGSTVTVYGPDGNAIAAVVAAGDGSYTIPLTPPLIAGETVTVTATDAAGNESAPTTLVAPDLTDNEAPEPPSASINADGTAVTGVTEPDATVTLYDANGGVLYIVVADGSGAYTILLNPPLTNGEALQVTATDRAGNQSEPTALSAPDLADTTPPEPPTGVISAAGDSVSGTAESGATVKIYDAGGTVIATGIAGTDGRYTIGLAPPLTEGQTVTATATDAAGNESGPTSLLAPDLTDTTAPDAPTAVISAAGDSISGFAEVGATVNVYAAGGGLLGTAVAGTDGRYTIPLVPPLVAGEVVNVTATDAAQNESAPTSATAPDLSDTTAPASPVATINGTGDTVSGTAEANTTVRVYDAQGNVLGTQAVGADGLFAITLTPPLTGGEQLSVTATNSADIESFPTSLFAPDLSDTDAPAAPSAVISAGGDEVSGLAEAGSTVIVRDANGAALGTAVAGTDGRYTIPLVPPLTSGEALSVTATDAAGNVSDPTALFAPNIPDAPDLEAYDNLVSGQVAILPTAEAIAPVSVSYAIGLSLGLVGLNLQAAVLGRPTLEFQIEPDHGRDLTFTYGGLLDLSLLGNYRVVVQQFNQQTGRWTTIDGSPGEATILSLGLLSGGGIGVAQTLGAGQYRAFLANDGVGLSLLTTLGMSGIDYDYTDIQGYEAIAVSGNIVTDANAAGEVDQVTATTVVQSVNGTSVTGAGTQVAGLYGTLTIDPNGGYAYVPDATGANIGQVETFEYVLFDPVTNQTATATLYVRIDSDHVDLVWDDADPRAPATFDFSASGDAGTAGVNFVNVTDDFLNASASLEVVNVLAPPRTFNSTSFVVTDDMVLSGTASMSLLVAVLASGSLALQQQASNGAWTNVVIQNYSVILGVTGTVASIDLSTLDLDPGTYRFQARSGGALGALTNVNIDVDATYLNQFEVADVDGATGNLLANDVLGSSFTQLQVFDGARGEYVDVAAGGSVTVRGDYGTLTVSAGGGYSYTPDGDANTPHFTTALLDTFAYRLVHPTGQIADGELAVTVEPAGAGVNAVVNVYDLDMLAMDDAGLDADLSEAANDYDASTLLADTGTGTPLLVRGEGDTVFALDASTPAFAERPPQDVDYGVPLGQEEDIDSLLLHSTVAL